MSSGPAHLGSLELDRVLGMAFALAAELHVARERNRALEAVLVRRGLIERAEVDAWQPDEPQCGSVEEDRARFVTTVLAPLLGDAARSGGSVA